MSDTAVTVLVTGLVTIVTTIVTFLTLWVKLKYGVTKAEEAVKGTHAIAKKTDSVSVQIAQNTEITKAGTEAAATAATTAATVACEAKVAAQAMSANMDKKLNGGVDQAIEGAIKPLREAMQDHALQDESNMKEIRNALDDLRKRLRY